mmetsp:Transcript_11834/g.21017  ORF Transcript_11834/g.21017 Transcript_11834/m.21017 type:complete len:95 (-) Transcript_11834:99-383(-)
MAGCQREIPKRGKQCLRDALRLTSMWVQLERRSRKCSIERGISLNLRTSLIHLVQSLAITLTLVNDWGVSNACVLYGGAPENEGGSSGHCVSIY